MCVCVCVYVCVCVCVRVRMMWRCMYAFLWLAKPMLLQDTRSVISVIDGAPQEFD